jgi:hypothetical protein
MGKGLRVRIVGCRYVKLATGARLAYPNHRVVRLKKDQERLRGLSEAGRMPSTSRASRSLMRGVFVDACLKAVAHRDRADCTGTE